MANNQHNIEKISVNVNTRSTYTGNLYKDNLPKIISSGFLDDADKLFSSICSKNEDLIIDHLTIELDVQDETDFYYLRQQLIAQLKEKLQEAKTLRKHSTKDGLLFDNDLNPVGDYSLVEGYIYFLKTGLKPWWISKLKLKNLLDANWESAFKDSENFSALINQLLTNHRVQQRFFKQQTNPIKVLCFLLKIKYDLDMDASWKIWKAEVINLPNNIKALVEKIVIPLIPELIIKRHSNQHLEKLIGEKIDFITKKWQQSIQTKDETYTTKDIKSWTSKTIDLLAKLTDDNRIKEVALTIEDSPQEKDLNIENDSQSIYLNHAGLVLVYPFIKALFKSCNLISNSGDIISIDIAVHLLYYVATKEVKPLENELTLEKILCGIPIQTPIERDIELTESHIQEAEEMLKAVSEHWTAIKTSSPDAIRSTFLIREGKLETDDFENKLIVKRQTEDILIDKLPWGISIVKTPWMKQFLTVEW